ncbi:MAG: cation:dicarboxylase symporter family transporter [Treponema sp.]|nr:cation:dicarboxylase symporter family transporter [Treponema sp.]
MKLWLKYLIGAILGAAIALIIPPQSNQAQAVLDFLVEFIIRFGRYALLPLLFFSITTACFKLRDQRLMLKTGLWIFITIIISTAFLVTLGLGSALIIKPPRIPMTIEKINEIPTLDLKEILFKIFPYSGFASLLNDSFLLPCFIFAGLAGAGAADDQSASKSAMSFFTSVSKVCYIVMSFCTELLAIGMIALTCRWALSFISLQALHVFTPLFALLGILLAITALIIYPLIIRLVCHDTHPYRVLYASIAPTVLAFFSGDTNITLPLLIRHGKESLGIRHRINAVTYPLFSIFARGGAALVISVCFIVILRTYSLLEIKLSSIIWIGLMSFLISFVLGEHSSGGAYLAITILCIMYGKGYESGYLLLRDAAPILGAFAAAFDALTAMFGSYIVGIKTQTVIHQELKRFI